MILVRTGLDFWIFTPCDEIQNTPIAIKFPYIGHLHLFLYKVKAKLNSCTVQTPGKKLSGQPEEVMVDRGAAAGHFNDSPHQ